jgi:hypothetical protein
MELAEETYSMISVATIAEIGRVEPAVAQRWTEDPSFPNPVARSSTGYLYDRRATEKWLLEQGDIGLEIPAAP